MVLTKNAIKLGLPTGVKTAMRSLLVCPLRAYIRYAPFSVGKEAAWNNLASHLWWLETDVTAKTIFGSRICADAAETVGRYIYYFGVWEPNLTSWIRRRLAPGDTFVDVGANVGYYTLLASQLVGESGRVVAIEALPHFFRTLQSNLSINGSRNVRALNIAAWDQEEPVTLFTQADHPTGTTTAVPEWADQWRLGVTCSVAGAPLSAILQPEEAAAARLIKIDVEGAEGRVISGLQSLIGTSRSDLEIIVEVSPQLSKNDGSTGSDVIELFESWGFHPYCIENDYSADAYCRLRLPSRPARLETGLLSGEQTDIIFSRIDADGL